MIQPYRLCSLIPSECDSRSDILYDPPAAPKAIAPARRNHPHKPVIPECDNAVFLVVAFSLLKPIRKKELILVSSHMTNSVMTLSASTNRDMEAINMLR